MRFVVATHGHCFDGLASAALFTRLQLERGASLGDFEYRGCGYGSTQPRADEHMLTGDENAILDYRFFPGEKLSWYFDHHQTAFASDDDRQAFEALEARGTFFFDPNYSSCTKLIADVARERFAVLAPELEELVHWADVVDAARFDDPAQAINQNDPVIRLVSVIEHFGDDGFITRLVPELLQKPLTEVASSKAIAERHAPLGKKHQRFVEQVRAHSKEQGRVVFVDLTSAVLETVGKFVTYALFPRSTYSVIVGLLRSGAKISVGYNPWSGNPLDTDISAICARYGGGGHPVVGGISFKTSELERARLVAREIAAELAE